MAKVVLEMDQVCKKFRRGEIYDSLRDLIPAITGRFFRATNDEQLEEQEFWALKDVSFQVNRGEAFGIIGYNGAGKSTILKLLSGIMKPTLGQLSVHGTLSALIEVGAGFHPDLTGRENIFLNGSILGMPKKEIREKFDEIVEFSGLEEFIDTPVKRYSSGMYARLGFSVAAHVNPDVLIVDEVLSVGDFMFQQKCVKRMHSVIRSGATVIFVSHNLRAVAELCNRCLLLERGRVIELGETGIAIKTYMERAGRQHADVDASDVSVTEFVVRGKSGDSVKFESGEKVWIDVSIKARKKVDRAAVVIFIKDESYYEIFNTSTERLGHEPLNLSPGETYRCTFELDLHLAHGTFYFGAMVYRYDIEKTYAEEFPAATVYVSSANGVRGAVNCNPRVLTQEVRRSTVE